MTAPVAALPLEEPMDYRALVMKLIAKRWWILSSTVVFAIASAIVAFTMAPVYRATVVLLPATDRGSEAAAFASSPLGGLASGLGLGLGPRDDETDEALAVLRSREFIERFITTHNLMPILFRELWDSKTGAWKADVRHPPTLGKAYRYFDSRICQVTQDSKTGLINLEIEWTDRYEAAAWANTMVDDLNQEMRSRALAQAKAAEGFLNEELQTTRTMEGRDAISSLMEEQLRRRMLASVNPNYAFDVVNRALPPDPDERVRPERALMIFAGTLLGLGIGVAGTLVFYAMNPLSQVSPRARNSHSSKDLGLKSRTT